MPAKAFSVLIGIAVVLVAQCGWAEKIVEMTEWGADVKIPLKIWEQFGNVGGKEQISFSSVQVRLVEKNSGVLIDPEITIKFPRGGGEIDLAHFVKDQTGTFRVYFDLEEVASEDKTKAYFISQARKRKIDGEVWGAGCNKYMDIKKFILGAGKSQGIEVNTNRSRHDSVLGGTFFFASGNQITQVTFKDSRQAHLFCDSVKAE
jgi:hypothetical protein